MWKKEEDSILGIDEAGRGSLIGPLIVAGALIQKKDIKKLSEIGVKDSKELTPKKRVEIIKRAKFCRFFKVVILPYEIDKKSINELEAEAMSALIKKSGAHKIYIDLPEHIAAFERRMEKQGIKKERYIAKHKADRDIPIVSLASIAAKVSRDRYIEKIKTKTGVEFGSGYPSDMRTKEAVKKQYKKLKNYVRKKWKITVTRLLSEFL